MISGGEVRRLSACSLKQYCLPGIPASCIAPSSNTRGIRCERDQKLQDLPSITKLLTVFYTFDSEDEALRSYKN